jgi:Amt family ammonium transporter
MFAIITPALAYGSIAERTNVKTYLVYLVFWSTFVYCVVAYWTWAPNGWLNKLGALDFAGGGPIHLTAGVTAVALAWWVGPRDPERANVERAERLDAERVDTERVDTERVDTERDHVVRPDPPLKIADNNNIMLGTAILWVGWFGFNGGSQKTIDATAINACIVTLIGGCSGGLSWMLVESRFGRDALDSVAFCFGAVAGLVAVTPAAGFIYPVYAIVFGVLAGAACAAASAPLKRIGQRWDIDDAFDVLNVHGVAGVIGSLLTGIFADKAVTHMANPDGEASINGGWMNGHFIQIWYQLVAIVAITAWAFCISILLLAIFKCFNISLREHPRNDWISNEQDPSRFQDEKSRLAQESLVVPLRNVHLQQNGNGNGRH